MVTRGRKFPIGEAAGRNAREPTSSLVKLKRRCRPSGQMGKAEVAGRETEAVRGIFRGSKGGMLWKISSPVLETRYSDV
ncbi:hypothetical protein DS62_01360 [Smithella sp. SC_K08D17]|nr:hypothetical protein KD27_06255 [Smithella sp. D17]KIE17690.1 hypothetical protein DS62_01360 [Smithella sp. SC_K08D17]